MMREKYDKIRARQERRDNFRDAGRDLMIVLALLALALMAFSGCA